MTVFQTLTQHLENSLNIRQYFKTEQQCVTVGPVGYLYTDTPSLSSLLLTYACPRWLIKTQGPCRMRCASADEGEIEGPTCISCISLRASEEICCLLRSESLKLMCLCWQRTNGIFHKRCKIVLACSKCQGKNVSWSTPLMKHAHEIKACILLPMFRLYMYKEVGRGRVKRETWQETSRERTETQILSRI